MPTSPARSYGVLFAAPVVLALASVLAGCPIYAADTCEQDPTCRAQNADAGVPDGAWNPPPDTGGPNCACSAGYVCTSVSSGRYECLPYDCRASEKACKSGEVCKAKPSGVYVCEPDAPVDCATTGCVAGFECKGDVPGKRVCVSSDPNACTTDTECATKTGEGSLCLAGSCKPPKDLCSDSTQCKAGTTCLDGRCVSKCSATCATGYTCDDKTGLCSGRDACGDSAPCTGGKTCLAGRCVDPCAIDGSCKAGMVCAGASTTPISAGGCVVDDRPVFFCDKDGTKEGTRDTCAEGSICLHHNCYIACTGPEDTTSCAVADKFPLCKAVETSSGRYNVCGSATSLGSECDPTSTPPKTCSAGKVCIDGFCK
jgi:hypothetical protein